MAYKSFSMELAGRTLTVEVGRVAKQANGAALMHYGDTTVLCTATASEKPREGIDFFPLSVEFEEKMYSVGKIPGGFNKRGTCSDDWFSYSYIYFRYSILWTMCYNTAWYGRR